MPLPQRPLGKTGVRVPIVGYGTAPLGKIKIMDAPLLNKSEKLLNHAIDQGITYLDTSPDYGSRPKLGKVMKTRRSQVFRAAKVHKRQRDDVIANGGRKTASRRQWRTEPPTIGSVWSASTTQSCETANRKLLTAN